MATQKEYFELLAKDGLSPAILRAQERVMGLRASVQNVGSSFSKVARIAGAAMASIGGALAVKNIVDATVKMQTFTNQLTFATGSVEASNEAMNFLKQTANSLGIALEPSIEGFAQITAASKGTNITLDDTKNLFSGIAKASSVLGLSAEDTGGSIRALTQIISKGKVQAEELRGQLGERIPGAFQIAARAMKMTTAELSKSLELGLVNSDDFVKKFADQLNTEFDSGLEKSTNSAAANINRFNNKLLELKLMFGEKILPVVLKFGEKLTETMDFVLLYGAQIKQVFAPIGELFKPLIKVFEDLFQRVSNGKGTIEGFKVILNDIGNVLLFLKPLFSAMGEAIAVVVSKVIDIATQFRNWAKESEGFMRTMMFFRDGVIQVFKSIGDVAKGIFGGIADLIGGAFTLDFNQIKKGLAQLDSGIEAAFKAPANVLSAAIDGAKKDLFQGKEFFPTTNTPVNAYSAIETAKTNSTTLQNGLPSGGNNSKDLKSGLSTIRSSAPKTFNVNIGKLIENLTFESRDNTADTSRLKDAIQKVLLEAVNDVQLAAI